MATQGLQRIKRSTAWRPATLSAPMSTSWSGLTGVCPVIAIHLLTCKPSQGRWGFSMSKTQQSTVIVTKASSITPEPIYWLWKGWLAKGKLHILAGDPGLGKTTIAISLAATVTAGGIWPDGSSSETGNVLIWSGEDDTADTLLPRLMAAGGDRENCYFISGVCRDGKDGYFDPKQDMHLLQQTVEKIGNVKLLVIDPIVAAIKGDGNGNVEVRRDLQPIVDFAKSTGCAVIGITHLSKGNIDADPMTRISGSIAFSAVPRMALVAAKFNRNGFDDRILVRGKSNIGDDDGGITYSLHQAEPAAGVLTNCIEWGDPEEGTASELLGREIRSEPRKVAPSAIESAKTFLYKHLSGGPTPVNLLQAKANQTGVSWASIKRASIGLEIAKLKQKDGWTWSLRSERIQDAHASPYQKDEHLDLLEHVEVPGDNSIEDVFEGSLP